ncbi:MAG: hypothetical protein ACKJSK_14475 [Roseibacillus sp.]
MKQHTSAIAALTLVLALAIGFHPSQAGAEPLLAVPGKTLYQSKLDSIPAGKWKAAKGQWEVTEGTWRGSQLAADNHGAVIRLQESYSDFVIDFEFKFEGARVTSLTINAVKGHMARILITPKTVTIRRDDQDHDGPDKAVIFAVFPTEFKAGTWHKVRLEMVGDTLLGKVDNLVAWGSDPLFKAPKHNPGFTCGGQSIALRNFSIRQATLNPRWAEVKKDLPKPGEKIHRPVRRTKTRKTK